MAVVSDIIYGALRLCGIRDTSNADRISEALSAFNLMLKTWEETTIIPTQESFTLTAGTSEYTIGTAGDFSTTRPISIMSSFIRDSSGTDYPVRVTMSVKDFDRISDKDAEGRPDELYYAAEYSSELGKIYFNSAPDAAETLYLTSHKSFSEYAAITDTVVQPPEYEKALTYNLAVDLAPEYSIQLMNTVIRQAAILKNIIEARNVIVPQAEFDKAMLR